MSRTTDGRRVRKNFAALSDARTFAKKQARGIERGEREAVRLSCDYARAFGTARGIASAVGLSAIEICRQLVAATKRLPSGMTLVQAVDDFAARHVTATPRTVAEIRRTAGGGGSTCSCPPLNASGAWMGRHPTHQKPSCLNCRTRTNEIGPSLFV